jgi:hypothetical protein|tara:strand:- start:193 stop:432 length:240 start_codon:yes stop_codon:yes gene_type:complete
VSSPIYRVIIEYGYRKKNSVRKYQFKIIDTFALTDNVELIKKDEGVMEKIITRIKSKHKDLDIIFKSIYVEGQYGNTTY